VAPGSLPLATPQRGLHHDDEGTEGVVPGKLKVTRVSLASGATMGRRSEWGSAVFDSVGVAAVAGGDGEVSVQHW
jgi:hypothetical protein